MHLIAVSEDTLEVGGRERVVGIPEALILDCLPPGGVVPDPLDQEPAAFALPRDFGQVVCRVSCLPSCFNLFRISKAGWVWALEKKIGE